MDYYPPSSLYVHIPFCLKRCHYCDFVTSANNKDDTHKSYVDALLQEAALISRLCPPKQLQTIFFGGGTPTILSPALFQRLGEGLLKLFPLSSNVEWTVEANPETLINDQGLELLNVLRSLGVNRLSLGVQSFKSDLLHKLGRIHLAETIDKSVDRLIKANFDNFSLDLMFGLPDQTEQDWLDTLKKAVSLGPKHLSCYQLTIEPGTNFYQRQKMGSLQFPPSSLMYNMYQMARAFLVEKCYMQYEISNFSLTGYECYHNINYWYNYYYYGLGLGACSYHLGQRVTNTPKLDVYIQKIAKGIRPFASAISVTRAEDMENFFILGLRCLKGVSIIEFADRYGTEPHLIFPGVIEKLIDDRLLCQKDNCLKLTEKGLLHGNDVFLRFLS